MQNPSRFPIEHPKYQYPASRNPYWGRIRGLTRVYSDHDPEKHRGVWHELFRNRSGLLHVEIGCNAGHVVTSWAAQNPKDNYIGLDYKLKPIFKAAEKADQKNLNNLLFLRANAERINYVFSEAEIDRLYIFFPDPWPRSSQWKHRFLNKERFRSLSKLVNSKGILHIKTDHPDYFRWIEKAIRESASWKMIERTENLYEHHPNPKVLNIPEVTLFEKIFIRQGIPIHSLKLQPV